MGRNKDNNWEIVVFVKRLLRTLYLKIYPEPHLLINLSNTSILLISFFFFLKTLINMSILRSLIVSEPAYAVLTVPKPFKRLNY